VTALEKHRSRVIAVHLKDWKTGFGMSPQRFARGFTVLGQGELADLLRRTIRWLKNYEDSQKGRDDSTVHSVWVIVEQDSPFADPVECARSSLRWLQEQMP